MSNRVKGFIVTLEHDIREDDAESISSAIRQLRGVASVNNSVTNPDDYINRMRLRTELWNEVYKIFYPDESSESH